MSLGEVIDVFEETATVRHGDEETRVLLCELLEEDFRAQNRFAPADIDLAPAAAPDLLQCPRCERHVAPIDDDGDLLCGRCRLVLYAG